VLNTVDFAIWIAHDHVDSQTRGPGQVKRSHSNQFSDQQVIAPERRRNKNEWPDEMSGHSGDRSLAH
jgi:hypothetical protein